AEIAHDRLALAQSRVPLRDTARQREFLTFARQAIERLEKFHPAVTDPAQDLDSAFGVYMNIGDHFVVARQPDDAIALCWRAGSLARAVGRRDALAMFRWVTGKAFQQRGDLEQALSAIQESVALQEPLAPKADVRDTMRLAQVLIYEGRILGQEN